jgi:hypothetical protein
MNIDSAFPSNYLKASDLGTGAPIVTIDRVEVEPVGRDREMKPVLYFRGKEKGVVLNKTNSNMIASLLRSRDTDDWAGCQVRLYATTTEFAGETVECIRIKAVGAQAQRQPAAPRQPAPARTESSEPVTALDDSDIPF